MKREPEYYVVEASVLPEIFIKVAEAKKLLATGEVTTVGEAAKTVGISRTAFYKYKESVMPFQKMVEGRVITIQLLLSDEAGLLFDILESFKEQNVNILTINSVMPNNGSTAITITADIARLQISPEEFIEGIRQNPKVRKAEVLAGF